MNYKVFGLLTIVVLLPACWGPGGKDIIEYTHQETTHEEITLGAQSRMSTDLDAGDIVIHGWDKESVVIDGTKHAAKAEALAWIEPGIVKGEHSIEIHTKLKRHNLQAFINYDVKAPYALRLRTIENKAGNVTVEDMRGPIDIETASGSVRVKSAQSDVVLKTQSGNVQLSFAENAIAKAEVHTPAGDVQIVGASRDVKVHGGSGNVTITQPVTAQGMVQVESRSGRVRVGNVVTNMKLESSSGSLLVTLGDIRPGTVMTLTTKSGRVSVAVPRTIDLAIDARTETGSIRSDFSLHDAQHHMFGVVGSKQDTGNRLTIHTTSGNITIQKK